jgi:phosphoglycerol geranylgeranyltransferase
MMEIRNTEKYILNEIKKQKTLCFPLIDSENSLKTIDLAKKLEKFGASAILVGGSSISDQIELSHCLTLKILII